MHGENTWKTARQATLHCLTGCGIGEVLGMVLSAWLNWSNTTSVVASVILAFIFGYSLTMRPLLQARMAPQKALQTAFAADTVSITTMEIMDNLIILVVPGAISATLSTLLFWWSLGLSLIVAFVVTVPVNYWLISRGKGHAVMHEHHHMH